MKGETRAGDYIRRRNTMFDVNRYPKWNDSAHDRPILSTTNYNWLADWAWLIVPVVVIALAYLIR